MCLTSRFSYSSRPPLLLMALDASHRTQHRNMLLHRSRSRHAAVPDLQAGLRMSDIQNDRRAVAVQGTNSAVNAGVAPAAELVA
jgi:hypothetical protein